MDIYSAPACGGQGFCADFTVSCSSGTLVYSEAREPSSGLQLVCDEAETGLENTQSCFFCLSRQLMRKPSEAKGFEEGDEPSETADPYSSLGYSRNSESHDHPEADTTSISNDDVRQNGVSRKGTTSKHLSKAEWIKGEAGWRHARLIFRALNAFLTINDPIIRAAMPEDRSSLWRGHMNRLRVFFARHSEALTWLWCRSSIDKDAGGEHLHALIHVPSKLKTKFAAMVAKHWPEPVGKLQWVTRDGTYPVAGGKFTSVYNYVFQGLAYPVAASMGLKWYYSGKIVGKRCGWSDDIGPRAVAAYAISKGIVTR